MKNYLTFLNESILTEKLTTKEYKVSDAESQSILEKYETELDVYKNMKEKGMDKTDRDIIFYYSVEEFIGFLVYNENQQNFNEEKERTDDEESFYNTLNIADVEIRKTVRKNKENPRFGGIILTDFINNKLNNYDGITLQAQNDYLLNIYYPKYGFIDLKSGGNAMVKWKE